MGMIFCGHFRKRFLLDGFNAGFRAACDRATQEVNTALPARFDEEFKNRNKTLVRRWCSWRNVRGLEFLAIKTDKDLGIIREDVKDLADRQKHLQEQVQKLEQQ